MSNETIEQTTARLMLVVLGKELPSEEKEILESALNECVSSKEFRLSCSLLDMAIAEEREACAEVAEDWAMNSVAAYRADVNVGNFIRARGAK